MAELGFNSSLSIGGPNTSATVLNSKIATVISANRICLGFVYPCPPFFFWKVYDASNRPDGTGKYHHIREFSNSQAARSRAEVRTASAHIILKRIGHPVLLVLVKMINKVTMHLFAVTKMSTVYEQ
jgi:hypothetical protein